MFYVGFMIRVAGWWQPRLPEYRQINSNSNFLFGGAWTAGASLQFQSSSRGLCWEAGGADRLHALKQP
jgi:hypothetical protein